VRPVDPLPPALGRPRLGVRLVAPRQSPVDLEETFRAHLLGRLDVLGPHRPDPGVGHGGDSREAVRLLLVLSLVG
jgi:hypothetical protein